MTYTTTTLPTTTNPILYYVHDPMCSWCYAFTPIWEEVKKSLGALDMLVHMQYVLGGLAADSDEAMPSEMKDYIKTQWQKIEALGTGIWFNYDFWENATPRRSTYPSCRAVLAVRTVAPELEHEALKIIQRYYYQEAKNPSDTSVLMGIAKELDIDEVKFAELLGSNTYLEPELDLTNKLRVNSFPSLVLQRADTIYHIRVDYHDAQKNIDNITNYL